MNVVVDVSGFDSHIQRFEQDLRPQWKQLGTFIAVVIRRLIGEFMNHGGGAGFNGSDRLRTQSGATEESFTPGAKWNVYSVEITDDRIVFSDGSEAPWLEIQEIGGFIRDQGHMASFFWAKWFETHQEEFKIIALSVMIKGGVTIPPHPLVGLAEAALFNEHLDEIAIEGAEILTQTWRFTS